MAIIRWLHLTDLHEGMGEQKRLWPDVKGDFFNDLETLRKKTGGPFDLILFTGDLTQTGSKADFDALDQTLEKIRAKLLELDPGCDPILLAVPGNHDLVRRDAESPIILAFERWHEKEIIRDDFWKNPKSKYRKLVNDAFKQYSVWQQARKPSRSEIEWKDGALPGDFSAVYIKDGLRLGIVGLNSAFLQLTKGDFEGKLDLDPQQLNAVCNGDPPEWIKKNHINLLMTHHPPEWLHNNAKLTFNADISKPGRFEAHLYGHMHQPFAQSVSFGGAPILRRRQGAALFGLEKYETKEGSKVDRIHGYGAGSVELIGKSGNLRLWPRKRVHKELSGSYRIERDPIFILDDDDAVTEIIESKLAVEAKTPKTQAVVSHSPGRLDQYDAFLSYASDDGKWCEELARKLQNQGIRVWFDRWEIQPGDHLLAKLDWGLRKSRKMIAVWSKNYFRDDKVWTLAESYSRQYSDPLSKQRPLIPVLIEECEPSPFLVSIRSIDFREKETDDFEMRFRELMNALDLPKRDDSIKENIDMRVRSGKDVEVKAPREQDEKFKDEIAKLYRFLGFQTERNTQKQGVDVDLYIRYEKGGTLTEAIVVCEEKRIGADECNRVLDKHNISRKILPDNYGWIAASAEGFDIESLLRFKDASINCILYTELLNQLAPMKEYVDRLISDYEKKKTEKWKGEDWFIRPFIETDIENKEHTAIDYIFRWLGNPKAKQLVVLGDLGTGKSTLAEYIAYELAKSFRSDPLRNPAPVLIPLGEIRKDTSLESIIVTHFSSRDLPDIKFSSFEHLVRIGKIIIFFDAFDEMADRVKWETTEKNYEQLSRASKSGGKFMLTCRTHYFKDKKEQRALRGIDPNYTESQTKLSLKLDEVMGETVYLQEFKDEQIKEYLKKARGGSAEEDWIKINSTHNLKDLASRPLLLEMMVKSLFEFKQHETINAANLYRVYTDKWLNRDFEKHRVVLSSNVKKSLIKDLAWRMHSENKNSIDHGDLKDFLERSAQGNSSMYGDEEIEAVAGEMRTASFLKHADKAGHFAFMHKSFREYFLAVKLHQAIADVEKPGIEEALNTLRFDQKIVFFLTLLDEKDQIREPLQKILTGSYIKNVSENALQILYWSGRIRLRMEEKIDNVEELRNALAERIPAGAQLAGAGLQEIVLEAAALVDANLSGADLTGANLNNVLLRNIDLSEAKLIGASVNNLSALEVDFTKAELSGVSFIDAKIYDSNFTETKLDRGAFISAELQNCKGLDAIEAPKRGRILSIVQLGAADSVNAVAYSSDGRLIATAGNDSLIRLYNADDGRLIRTLEGHQSFVTSVAFSTDDKQIASGSWDNTVRLWEASTGKLIRTLEGHQDIVNSVAFSTDDKRIASGSDDKTVRLWEASTGKLIRTLEGHQYSVTSVAFSTDDKQIASGSLDFTVRLWEASTGKLIRTLEGYQSRVNSVAFSKDDKQIAGGSSDATVRLWEASTGKLIRTLEGHKYKVTSVAFSTDDKQIASGSYDFTVRLWDASTGKLIRTLEGHQSFVTSVAFSTDDKQIASGSDDKTVRLWEASTGKLIRTLEGHQYIVNSVAFSTDDKQIASGSSDNTVRLWEASTGKLIRTLEGHKDIVNSVAFSTDDKQIASGSSDNTVRLWEASTGKLIRTLEGHKDSVTSVAFSTDDKQIASGSDDDTVRLWEASTGKLIRTLEGHQSFVTSVVFSKDDKHIASGSSDDTVRLWEASTGKLVRTLEGHQSRVNSVAFSTDDKQIASGSSDKTVRLWEASTGKLIRTLEGHQYSVTSVAFSTDDKHIASGSLDNTVRLWEASTGKLIRTLEGHLGRVNEVKFSTKGKYLIAAGAAGRLQFWDYESGDVIIYLYGFERGGWLALLPDGRFDGTPEGIRYLRYSEIGRFETYSAEELKEFYDPEAVRNALEKYVK